MSVPTQASANATASAKLSGARGAGASWLGRVVAAAGARDLSAFVVPGPEVARARGLDLRAAGLGLSPTPRHASVLVVVGRLPEALGGAAAVAYAQMPRPRAVLAVGTKDVYPLPGPDVRVEAGQDALDSGVAELRRLFANGAFDPEAEDFEAALRSRTEYACPMHPEVVRDEPGVCPKCGMDLVSRETSGGDEEEPVDPGHGGHHEDMDHGDMDQDGEGTGEGHGHADHTGHGREHDGSGDGGPETAEHAAVNHGGMGHGAGAHGAGAHGAGGHETHDGTNHGGHEGMGDADEEHGGHGGMDHGGMDHGGMGFMSMVEMTQGTPRSSDGLQMEWVEAPFGPLFPGLPGGLSLTFTLDGDTVAEAEAGSAVGARAWGDPWEDLDGPVGSFVERLAGLDPLSPFSYRLLALRAVESAAGARADKGAALARVGALERERAAGHLNWLAGFGHVIGYPWLAGRAEDLQLALLRADVGGLADIRTGVRKLARRVERTPLLRRKLAGVGKAPDLDGATGPVARAAGRRTDARLEEGAYRSLGFEPVVARGGDALARLRVRVREAERSLELVEKAGAGAVRTGPPETGTSGEGTATVETPRGAARLAVVLEGGRVTVARLETPSTGHMGLVKAVAEGRELGDVLAGVASLDLSPWEVPG